LLESQPLDKRLDADPDELRHEIIMHFLRTEIYNCTDEQLQETDYETAMLDYQLWAIRKDKENEARRGGAKPSSGTARFGVS
jgi:hypothetical protein